MEKRKITRMVYKIIAEVFKVAMIASLVSLLVSGVTAGLEAAPVFFVAVLMLIPASVCFHIALALNCSPKKTVLSFFVPAGLPVLFFSFLAVGAKISSGEGAGFSIFFFFQLTVTAIAVCFVEMNFISSQKVKMIFFRDDETISSLQKSRAALVVFPYFIAASITIFASLCPAIMDPGIEPRPLLFGIIAAACLIPATALSIFVKRFGKSCSEICVFLLFVGLTEILIVLVAFYCRAQNAAEIYFSLLLIAAYIAIGAIFYYLAYVNFKNRVLLKHCEAKQS